MNKKILLGLGIFGFFFLLGILIMYFYPRSSQSTKKLTNENIKDMIMDGHISFGDEKGEIFKSQPHGSGGFISYVLVVNKNGISKIVYEKDGLYHGSVSVVGNTIEEVSGKPLPDDPNCCPSYYKYRYISFTKGKPEVVREFKKASKDLKDSSQQPTTIEINYQETVLNELDEKEAEKIKEFINTFEKNYSNSTKGFRYRKSAKEMFSLFIPPESQEEQQEINRYLGDFGDQIGDDNSITFLYSSHGYNHTNLMHYIREINKSSDKLIVKVEELRFYYYRGEVSSGFIVEKKNLVFELKEIQGEYKIAKYYHEGENSKYDGLIIN